MSGFKSTEALFKDLTEAEVEGFKKWARDNHKPGDEVSDIWHPVIREECRLIDLK